MAALQFHFGVSRCDLHPQSFRLQDLLAEFDSRLGPGCRDLLTKQFRLQGHLAVVQFGSDSLPRQRFLFLQLVEHEIQPGFEFPHRRHGDAKSLWLDIRIQFAQHPADRDILPFMDQDARHSPGLLRGHEDLASQRFNIAQRSMQQPGGENVVRSWQGEPITKITKSTACQIFAAACTSILLAGPPAKEAGRRQRFGSRASRVRRTACRCVPAQ